MKKSNKYKPKTPSFILELPLITNIKDEHILTLRFESARQLYNAVLGEALKRLNLMKESKQWQYAHSLKKNNPDKFNIFKSCTLLFKFTDYDLQSYGTECKNSCFIGDHLDSHTAQKISSRAFKSAQRYQLRKSGKPRFKSKQKSLNSLESKSNASGIRWRDNRIEWNNLNLKPIFDRKDKYEVQSHALQSKVKYCRIIRKIIKGKQRFYVQLILSGFPKLKNKNIISNNKACIDIGPSTIALVSKQNNIIKDAFLKEFCPNAKQLKKNIRRIQRAMDRSKRLSNPNNFNPNGTVKKGNLKWIFSNGYIRLKTKLSELYRILAAYRKTEHGKLANIVISKANIINAEKLSYKSFQKNYGKSVRDKAPGMFMSILRRKAENAGGEVIEFSTKTTKLSQTCQCGNIVKKPLSQRWHKCPLCGIKAQRDLYSAYLGLFVAENNGTWNLDIDSAYKSWNTAEPLLEKAISDIIQIASDGRIPASFGIKSGDRAIPFQNPVVIQRDSGCCNNKDHLIARA